MLTSARSTGGLLDEHALEASLSFEEPSYRYHIPARSHQKYWVGWCFSSKEEPSSLNTYHWRFNIVAPRPLWLKIRDIPPRHLFLLAE